MRSCLTIIPLFAIFFGSPGSSFPGPPFSNRESPQERQAAKAGYDPLRLPPDADEVSTRELTVVDADRDRKLPIRVYLPVRKEAAPVVLFSHGLGGARTNDAFLGKHWAARGYVAVFLQHPGSDDTVWRDTRPLLRMRAMRRAANAENYLLRIGDVSAVLSQLDRWGRQEGHPLFGRMDLSKVGMSGHSFGALTTQAVSGQTSGGVLLSTGDQRIAAAIMFSPSTPRGGNAAKAFGGVKIPWLLMTGTKDVSPIGNADLESRLGVYPALPTGNKYEVVLKDAEHSAFSDRALPGDHEPRNPNHHRVMLALSTAFWDAFLRGDPQARAWLDADGPRGVLEPGDRWQHK